MRRLSSLLLSAALVFAFAPAALAAAPANDERSGATAITTLPYAVTNFDTTEATANPTDPLCWDLTSWVNTVWYSYTATATGRIMVDQAATVDHNPFIRVWDTADESVILSCYDLNSPAYVEAVAGHTYMIMFADADVSDGSGGMLSFTVSTNALPSDRPANDEQFAAEHMAFMYVDTLTVTADTTLATANSTDPLMPGPYGPPDVQLAGTTWYSWISPDGEGYSLTVDVSQSDYEATVLVLASDQAGNLTYMNHTSSYVTVDMPADRMYYFMVGDKDLSDGVGGNLVFTIIGSYPAPDPLLVEVATTSAVLQGTDLVVSGTWTQLAGAGSGISGTPTVQGTANGKAGKVKSYGSNYGVIDPAGTWTVTITPQVGSFTGRTTVLVEFFFDDGFTTHYPVLTMAVTIPKK